MYIMDLYQNLMQLKPGKNPSSDVRTWSTVQIWGDLPWKDICFSFWLASLVFRKERACDDCWHPWKLFSASCFARGSEDSDWSVGIASVDDLKLKKVFSFTKLFNFESAACSIVFLVFSSVAIVVVLLFFLILQQCCTIFATVDDWELSGVLFSLGSITSFMPSETFDMSDTVSILTKLPCLPGFKQSID